MAYDGSIKIDSRINSQGFNKGISGMISGVKALGVAIGVAFGITAMVNFGKSAVTVASELSSAMIGLQSVVSGTGNSFTEAKSFINDYIKDGLVPITNATTAYKNLLMRGYDTSQIETVLTALKDSASFGRQASLTLGNAVQSATEGLKNENSILVDNAGVTKNVSLMWKDYADSIGTTVGALTKQQKIQAEVAGIMEESRFQVGDAAKLAGTYAGQVSALGVSFYNLKTAVGNSIIAVISKVLPYIKAAIDTLVIFFNKVASIMSALFGVQIAGAIDSVTDKTNAAADAQDNLANSTTNAGKAAKGALAAFDEINVLQMDDGSGTDTPAGADVPGITAGALDTTAIDNGLDELTDKVEAFKNNFITFIDPVVQAFGRLKDALEPLGKTIWEGLKWAWDNIIVPFGTWAIQDAVPAFLDLLSAAATLLNSALKALQPFGIWLWENFLQPLAEWTGGVIISVIDGLTQSLNDLSDAIDKNPEGFSNFVTTLLAIATAISGLVVITNIATWIVAAVPAILGFISTLGVVIELIAGGGGILAVLEVAGGGFAALGAAIAAISWPVVLVVAGIVALIALVVALIAYWPEISAAAQKAWEWIVDIWGIAWSWFKENVIDPIINLFAPIVEFLSIVFYDAWLVIKYIWGLVSNWFSENVIEPLKKIFSAVWDFISEKASEVWDKIVEIWNPIAEWFTTHVTDPIKNAFKTALDWVSEKFNTIFTGIKDFVKGIINGIIDMINGMLNGAVSGINGLINSANGAGGVIPGWKTIPTVVAPQIPRLATGAVIPANAPFAAILGDQKSGTNIEAPADLIRQIVSEEMGKMEITASLKVEGSMAALVREMHPLLKLEAVRIGGSLIRATS
jgi:hypothetical protein